MVTSRLLLAAVLALSVGCTGTAGSRTLIPVPPTLSDYQPTNPLTERSQGLLGRSVYRTSEGEAFRVEFDDLLVQPSSSAVSVPLDQAAVVEVRSGEGEAIVGERRIDLRQGSTFGVSSAERLLVQPRNGPVALRVVQIVSR